MSWSERQVLHQSLLSDVPIWSISPALLASDRYHQLEPLIALEQTAPMCEEVTVVIPTHRRVPMGLSQWLRQAKEVILLRNAPVPELEPLQWAERHERSRLQIIDVPWQGHGPTRQFAIDYLKTPYVFFSVDDAIPLDSMLWKLMQYWDREIDALVPRQLPYPNAERLTQDQLAHWMPHRDAPYLIAQSDHVGTLYRVEDLRRQPIPAVSIAEDLWWSYDKRVFCVPNACIVHSHPRKTLEIIQREYQIHSQIQRLNQRLNRDDGDISLVETVLSAGSAAHSYGLQEGCRTFLQNLARFAAHKV